METKNAGGRPRATERLEKVIVKLPRSVVEIARRQAQADDRPMSAYLRRLITRGVEREDADAEAV